MSMSEMTRRAGLRASDADREQVAERLRQATVEGRLLAEELEERLGAALSARTYGELDAIVSDLPTPIVRHRMRRPSAGVRPAVAAAVGLLVALMVLAAVAFAPSGHSHSDHGWGGAGGLVWLVWIAFAYRYYVHRRRR
jgi:Domain of unknown function (DUF1707)